MISRFEAWMNGEALSGIHDDLYILDITHNSSRIQNTLVPRAKGDGALLTNRYKQQASVTIDFELHIYDTNERQIACQNIAKWAMQGGILETNDRRGQQLRCICETPPVVGSALRWTDSISMTFSAYSLPYWEEKTQANLALTGENVAGTLFVPGNAEDAYVDAEITAIDAINTLTLTAQNTTILLTGLDIASGGVVTLSHDENGILSIKTGNISLLDKRTAESSDDLLAASGKNNTLSISANGNIFCKFSARGLWH